MIVPNYTNTTFTDNVIIYNEEGRPVGIKQEYLVGSNGECRWCKKPIGAITKQEAILVEYKNKWVLATYVNGFWITKENEILHMPSMGKCYKIDYLLETLSKYEKILEIITFNQLKDNIEPDLSALE